MDKKMNRELTEITAQWKALERKTDEQRQYADEFYDQNLMGLIERDFIERNEDRLSEKAEYLVVSVGTSYEPIVLNIRLLKPRRILFLHTAETEGTLEKIVAYCGLVPEEYEKRRVSNTDSLDIYREIRRCYISWGRPRKMFIDFTGGTKAMSASAAMAGVVIDVQLVYVGTEEYLPDFRKPNPGSETFHLIDNPLAVFGDFEIEKAMALFERHNYAGAKEKFGELKEKVPDPSISRQMNLFCLLNGVYESWDALEFEEAYKRIKELNDELRGDREKNVESVLADCGGILEKQEEILGQLSKIPGMLQRKRQAEVIKSESMIYALMFTLYQSARIRERQEKYDMATLLFYRLLEMIEQRRLAHYDLDAARMDYDHIKYDTQYHSPYKKKDAGEQLEHFRRRVREIKQGLFRRGANDYLPDQVSLLEGFIVLAALGDPIVHGGGNRGVEKLRTIRTKVYLRNNSIFAHGLGPVGYEDYKNFRDFVLELFKSVCRIEQTDYQTCVDDIKWISPSDLRR